MIETIKRILELQLDYSSENTPAMRERGILLREQLCAEFETIAPQLSAALGRFGPDFDVEASDGKGRKSELPWLRFHSSDMSPGPREGFCGVVYFSVDGKAVHVTIGCGASSCDNGAFTPLPEGELDDRTTWARRVIEDANDGSLEPFMDPPEYGATRRMGLTLQRATVVSKRIGVPELVESDFVSILVNAASFLRLIYEAESDGRLLSHADMQEHEGSHASGKPRGRRGQGIRLSPEDRILVERRAMRVVESYLGENGYGVRDTSANKPYDFEATKGGATLRVEVKGTTADTLGAIAMTRNEVDLHRHAKGQTALIVVYRIRLTDRKGKRQATGGSLEPYIAWDIDDWRVVPTQYRVEPP
ncbi:MAG: DUF3578 domain-containing protein [Gammaproteobacteria bacterium]|nr:DUF3578 domain-containing protein [Gammaproteobacteria bacterium]